MKVAIVGGGAAGIAAAYTLLQAMTKPAIQVYLFEARGRYGGRAMTDTSIDNYAFDMGAQYIQDPTLNPWTAIAKRLNFDTVEDDVRALLRVDKGNGWVDAPVTTPDVATIVAAITGRKFSSFG